MDAPPSTVAAWRTAKGHVSLEAPLVAGILNVTPDSFWDGGRYAGIDAALAHAARLVDEGAGMLDVGGESTRPGAAPVTAAEERRRVVPVIAAIVRRWPALPVAVDTVRAETARAALDAGASIVNDVSGLRLDPALGRAVADAGAGLVLMHSRGGVADMASYRLAAYGADPVGEVAESLQASMRHAADAGVEEDFIVLDPGLGFSKRTAHSVAILARLDRIAALGRPVLIGASRKRFVGELAGALPAEARLEGSLAAATAALLHGARIFRVHDVASTIRALAVAEAIRLAR
jgi:dihydropteroate synthase